MQVNMGIIKVEVSLPEAAQAIEEFGRNRIQAFEAITSELKTAVGRAFNSLLQTEMTLFLGKAEQSGNQGTVTRSGSTRSRGSAVFASGCPRTARASSRVRSSYLANRSTRDSKRTWPYCIWRDFRPERWRW